MRNYVKPESEMIALNMNENIAASSESISFQSKAIIFSDDTGTYVSTSEINWTGFKTATAGWSNMAVGGWLMNQLGNYDLYNEMLASCVRGLI